MRIILHVTTPEAWEAARDAGEYRAASLEVEGFIHCSRPEQMRSVLARHFAADRDLIVLEIDRDLVRAPVRDEKSGDFGDFPHVYGPLNLDSVVRTRPIEAGEGGART